jgi:trk system potassium uptake protein TrkH
VTVADSVRLRAFARRYAWILRHTGSVAVVSGVVVASPSLAVLAYPSELPTLPAFLLPGAVLALLGLTLRRLEAPDACARPLDLRESAVIVLLSWVLAVVTAAVPFMWAGGLDFTGGMFEATSGWTTTGLTVVDVTTARPTLLLLRSVLQLAGGAGLAILMLSALVGPSGTGLASAEGKEELLVPVVDRSAVLVVRIYGGYALVGVLALRLAGMSWFDAINHAFTAVSTGGFSTRPESIGAWDSPAIEAVTIPLMVLGNLSFVTAWAAVQGRWRAVLANGEVRTSALLGMLGAVVIWWSVAQGRFPTASKAIRVAVFETATALTTTGFSTVGYLAWPAVGWCVLVTLMVVGGGTCSTAGGLKQYRVYVLYRHVREEIRRRLGPRRAVVEVSVPEGESRRFLPDREVAWIGVLILGTAILAAYGNGLRESLFEFASALGTVGLSVGVTRPDAPHGLLWTETVGMFLGRLEFFTVVVGAARLVGDGGRALHAWRTEGSPISAGSRPPTPVPSQL